jgi:hypothetical protein
MSEESRKPREWWPSDWADEWMPPARPEPSGFLINANGHCYLGYAFDAEGVTDHEKRYFSRALNVGDIVKFICCDDLGEIDITFDSSGTYVVHDKIPEGCNAFWIAGDNDTYAETVEAFVEGHITFDKEMGLLKTHTETVRAARWSDELPHKFTVTYDAGAPSAMRGEFVAVSAAEARQ